MISVVIPAHDEESVIGSTLRTMLRGAGPADLDVVVVCNGCSDATAEVARDVGGPVRVVETPVASKPLALDLGDAEAHNFPRAYVDADVQVSAGALETVSRAMEARAALAAAPRIALDLEGRPWGVRAYYRQWLRTPFVRNDMVGSGVYVLSRDGRARFDRFPEIIADDLFVRNLFRPGERISVPDAVFTKQAPYDLRTVVRIKGRMYAGHQQLAALEGYDLSGGDVGPDPVRALMSDVMSRRAVDAVLFAGVNVLGRLRGARKMATQSSGVWERDESTRGRGGDRG